MDANAPTINNMWGNDQFTGPTTQELQRFYVETSNNICTFKNGYLKDGSAVANIDPSVVQLRFEATASIYWDKIIPQMYRLKHLQKLVMRNTLLTKHACLLREIQTLQHLEIFYSDVGDESAQAISTIKALTSLSLRGCRLTSQCLPYICQLPNLTYLDIQSNNCQDLKSLGQMKLQTLIASSCDLDNISIQSISKITTLKHLDIRNNSFTNISPLKTLAQLEFMDISNCKVVSLDAIINLPLRTIFSNGNRVSAPPYFPPTLIHLHMNNSRIGDDCKTIHKLKSLQVLNFIRCDISCTGFYYMTYCTNMMDLCLEQNNIQDKGARHISRLIHLKRVDLSRNKLKCQSANAISRIGGLVYVNLQNNLVSDEGFMSLFKLRNVKSLRMNGNKVSALAVKMFRRISKIDVSSMKVVNELKNKLRLLACD